MDFIKKFGSRKLVVSFIFGIGVPVLFKSLQISEIITLTSLAIGAGYLGANVLSKTKGVE